MLSSVLWQYTPLSSGVCTNYLILWSQSHNLDRKMFSLLCVLASAALEMRDCQNLCCNMDRQCPPSLYSLQIPWTQPANSILKSYVFFYHLFILKGLFASLVCNAASFDAYGDYWTEWIWLHKCDTHKASLWYEQVNADSFLNNLEILFHSRDI